VISPLFALMEDQVARLKEKGFTVERIHSGRPRADRTESPRLLRVTSRNINGF
jgi:superfamily II DNA helicase RecQ